MEFQEAQNLVLRSVDEIKNTFEKVPGSAMVVRYIRSSYQDDPFRSAIELILVIFFVRYLLAPRYATHSGNFVKLSEEVGCSRRAGWNLALTLNRRLTTSWRNGFRKLLLRRRLLLRRPRPRSYL